MAFYTLLTSLVTHSFLPLLLLPLPLSLSPVHLITLLVLTTILNKPCSYCSILLVILFASSCRWSDRCFINLSQYGDESSSIASWFVPRLYATSPGSAADTAASSPVNGSSSDVGGFLLNVTSSTVSGLIGAVKGSAVDVVEETRRRLNATAASNISAQADPGIGAQWLRQLLGRSEWTLPCVGVKVVI